jgi:phospholipase/carboxylesterase
MRWLIYSFSAFVLFLALHAMPAAAQVDEAAVNAVDPMQASAGDFLDADLAALETAARNAYDAKDYKKAAQYYLVLLRQDIHNANALYNLSCCYGLMGDAALAAQYLERAEKAGFDYSQAQQDPDFDGVRDSKEFKDLMAKLDAVQMLKAQAQGKLELVLGSFYGKCYVRLPVGYDPAKKYTLLVGLHGFGDNAEHFSALWERFNKRDFIYASLESAYPFASGTELGYSWVTGLPNDDTFWKTASLATVDYVAAATAQLKSKYSVDETYLLGFSQGCTMAYLTGILKHDSYTGIICFAGRLETGILTEADIAAAKSLRVFIVHGSEDRMVEFSAGEKARDTLAAAGYNVTFEQFVGAHRVPPEQLQAAERWMKRELPPVK